MRKSNATTWVVLHILLMAYSVAALMGKLAAKQVFLSWGFFACYGGMLAMLALYALGWQQVIKKLPLTSAFANKAVTVAWGVVWGVLVLGELPSLTQVVGCVLVIAGIVLYANADGSGQM